MVEKNKNLIIGINLVDFGSTGNIMLNSLEYAHENGPFDVVALVPFATNTSSKVRIESFGIKFNKIKHYFFAALKRMKFPIVNDGNRYRQVTRKLIKLIKKEASGYDKVFIHLHNIHDSEINVNVFYKWLRKHKEYQVFYTLHDCWTFTGGCYYYDFVGCKKWQKDCKKCPQHILYTHNQLEKRTALLNNIQNLLLIPCSQWLSNELGKSKLSSIKRIINNGETSLEKYNGKSNLKKELGIEDKKVLISVSAYWNDWKGIKYFYQLADKLPDDYVILLVGGGLPKEHQKIIHIPQISDSNKLAEYYSISDVFVSLTQSDNFPLVLMESQICGVPIVGFGHGGTPELITEKSGIMVGKDNDVDKLFAAIKNVIENHPFKKEDIIASGNRFKKYECAKRQLVIYNNLL